MHILLPDGSEKLCLEKHRDQISCVAFSPKADKLASGCANKEIVIWDANAGTPLVTGLNGFHTARISCLAWSPGGTLASGGVDATVLVWDLDNKAVKHKLVQAHMGGAIAAISFLSDTEFVSTGGDCCIKKWAI